jgi:peptidoglycan hydrolase-like protein with peptidoglycan-binding domain
MGWLGLLLLWAWASTQGDKGDKGEGETPADRAAQLLDPWATPPASDNAPTSDMDARAAARALANFYANATAAVRAGNAPAEAVKPLQRRMGLEPDGFIGPLTRARVKDLGVIL